MLGRTKQIVVWVTLGGRKLTLYIVIVLIVLTSLFNAHDALAVLAILLLTPDW